MNFKKFVKENKLPIIFSTLMIAGLVILPQFSNASVLDEMKSELKYDFMPLEKDQVPQNSNIREDEFEICSFEEKCFTIPADDIFDDETIEKIWMRFQANLDTYPRD